MKTLLFFLLAIGSFNASAQFVSGFVTDMNNMPVSGVEVLLISRFPQAPFSGLEGKCTVDFMGRYSIKGKGGGIYDLVIAEGDKKLLKYSGLVLSDLIISSDFALPVTGMVAQTVLVQGAHRYLSDMEPVYQQGGCRGVKIGGRRSTGTLYIINDCSGLVLRSMPETKVVEEFAEQPSMARLPLFGIDGPGKVVISRHELKTLPYTDLRDIVATTTTVHQWSRGADLGVSGSRNTGVAYIIDGMHVPGN